MKDNYENRITRLETTIEHTKSILSAIQEDLKRNESIRDFKIESLSKDMRVLSEGVQKGFTTVYEKFDKRFERLDLKIESSRSENWSQFRWVMGTIFILVGGILTNIVLKNLHLF